MAAGRMPHREVLDGVAVIFGGAFLITPGLPDRHRRPPAPASPHAHAVIRAFARSALRGCRAAFVVRTAAPSAAATWRARPPSTRPTDPPRIER